MYDAAAHVVFDVVINTLIIINMVPIVLELASDDDASYMMILNYINYVYCGIYISEALWKVRDIFCCSVLMLLLLLLLLLYLICMLAYLLKV